ncbi:MAG: hypothetical protein FJX93_01535 [Bacteroidetes bacterium]|nr:hypothetical protein [Bacteroidota bacterium]
MQELIVIFIGLVPALYLVGRLYSDLRGKACNATLNLDEVRDNIRKSNGFWEWFVPIAVAFAFAYNIVATAAWMVAELVQLGLSAAKWGFKNIFVTGPWFILKMVWHYLVVWPWKLLRMAFGEIMPSLTRSQFIIAFTGISLCLAIYFIGVYDAESSDWLTYAMSVLSVFPLGWAVGKIGLAANGKSYTSSERNTYFKHLGFLIALFAVVTLAEAFVINLGTHTSMSSALSHLFLFGTFWGSALLLFNGLILLFSISALPFISADFSGSYKDLLFAVWATIRTKGLRFAVAVPAMLLPMTILGIVPKLLTEGINHISNTITEEVYANRLVSLKFDEPGTMNVYDLSIPEDSVAMYFDEWVGFYTATVNNRAIELDRDGVTGILSSNSDEKAATPYYLVFGMLDSLNRTQYNAIALDEFKVGTSDLSEASEQLVEETQSRVNTAEKGLTYASAILKDAEADRNKICNLTEEAAKEKEDPKAEKDAKKEDTPKAAEGTACDRANERVNAAQDNLNNAKTVKARADFIAAQVEGLNAHIESLSSSTGWSTKLAWVLGAIFLALLAALQFGLPFVLFARVNARIYAEDDDQSIVVLDSIRAMQREDKNQPLLGLGVTLLIYLMYTGTPLMNFEFPDLPSPVRSSIDYGVDVYEDVLGSYLNEGTTSEDEVVVEEVSDEDEYGEYLDTEEAWE